MNYKELLSAVIRRRMLVATPEMATRWQQMATLNTLTPTKIKSEARDLNGRDKWLNDGGGLWLHLRPTGSGAWRFRYSADGRRYIMDLGDASARSLADARREAARLREQIASGINPVEHAKAEQERQQREQESRVTFAAAVEKWRASQLASRKDAGAEAVRILHKDVLNRLGERDLQSVRKGELMECLDGIVDRGARRLANVCLRELKQFFKWAAAREWVERDPLASVQKSDVGGPEIERDRVLSAEEIALLRDRLKTSTIDPRTKPAIWIMLSTLARVGELTTAKWADVDLERATWHIPETKNGLPHTVFLSDFALQQFKELHAMTGHSEWIFPSWNKGGPVARSIVTRQVFDRQQPPDGPHRCSEPHAFVLPGGQWTPHDLRRTGATIMGELGVLSQVIERCLNHREAHKVVRTYQRQELVAERRQAWQMLGERLAELVNGTPRKVVMLNTA